MSLQPVNIFILDNHAAPVEGVLVRVYNEDATAFITQGASDADGFIGLLLESATSPYQLRFFKTLYSFANPLLIEVSELEANEFDVPCLTLDAPTPTDARYCIAYGHFKDTTGRALAGIRIEFVPQFNPTILEGQGVLPGRVSAVTDDAGYAQIQLLRNGIYEATISSRQDYRQTVSAPDQPNVRLPDLLFPIVSSITFTPALPNAMSVGDEEAFAFSIMRTDLNTAGTDAVQWSSSDPNVLAVLPASDVLTLRALAVGTVEVRATRADNGVVRIPDPGIAGVPVTVVVS